MGERIRQQVRAPERHQDEVPEEVAVKIGETAVRSPEEIDAELEALMNEIDAALETNAEEMVANFIQKGGE